MQISRIICRLVVGPEWESQGDPRTLYFSYQFQCVGEVLSTNRERFLKELTPSTDLFSTSAQHALDAETYRHNIHGRTPVLVQYRETNMAVTVDVGMDWNVVSCEYYLGGREGGRKGGRKGGREGGKKDLNFLCVNILTCVEERDREGGGRRRRRRG